MYKIKSTISVIILLTTSASAQQADQILGKYHLPNKLDIEIYKTDMRYYGKIIALNGFENDQIKDINNPEFSQRRNFLVGMVIIENLEFDKEEKKWVKGIMYSPEKGMFFDLKITEIRQKEIVVVGSKYLFGKHWNGKSSK